MNRNLELELLSEADIGVLLYMLQEFPKYCKHLPEEKQKEYVRLVLKLDDFVAIHRTRCNDLIQLTGKIETARMEYGKLRDRIVDLEGKVKEADSLNNTLIDEYLEGGSIPTQKPYLP